MTRLRERMREDMRIRNLSERTQDCNATAVYLHVRAGVSTGRNPLDALASLG